MVASDGSEFSANAVSEAIHMSKKCNAELHMMSSVAIAVVHEALGENIYKQELNIVRTHLEEIKLQAESAEEIKVDLIIMGRCGRRGMARKMVGHAPASVIGAAHCNVLVIPRNTQRCLVSNI